MKKIRISTGVVCVLCCLIRIAVPAAAAEMEPVMAQSRNIAPEWLALLFSSVWAFVLQLLRLRK